MRLLAPANSIAEAEQIIAAGADEIYFGGVTTIYSNYPTPAKGWTVGEKNLSVQEFRDFTSYCRRNKIPIQYNVYTDCFSDDVFNKTQLADFFAEYLKIGIVEGVENFLLDDIGAIMRAKRLHPQMEICGSFLFDIINVEQLQFFKALNVSLVELSPQLTIGEIAQLSKNSPIKLGLVGHLNCAAFEGACYIDHFIDYENEILPIGLPCKGNFKLDNGKGLTKEGTWLDSTLSCSLCNIVSLMDCKIEYLKIPGRHIDYSLILEWTKVYRYVIDYVKNTPNKSKEELHKKILGKFPNWRLWCRLNRKKGCLYDEDNQIARFYVGK